MIRPPKTLEELFRVWKKNNWFPHFSEEEDSMGILGVGPPLNVGRLQESYLTGVFPWPTEGHLLWCSPPKRGVLHFDKLHVSRSLRKKQKSNLYRFTKNKAFSVVIRGCQKAKRRGQVGTWITEEMISVYEEAFSNGFVMSTECWRDEKLIGGIYGFEINGVFSGESVFGDESDVAKLCLLECIEDLKARGLEWMDIQMVTPLTESFGGELVNRKDYLNDFLIRRSRGN